MRTSFQKTKQKQKTTEVIYLESQCNGSEKKEKKTQERGGS